MTKQKLLLLIFLFFFASIIIKLFYLQVVHPNLSSFSPYLFTRKIVSERGKIFDRSGLPLSINKTAYLLFAEPKKIIDLPETVARLEPILKMGESTLSAKIDSKKDWVAIKNGLDKQSKNRIEALGLTGVGFEDQYQRFYPEASQSAHILGFVGKNSEGENVGYFGVEGFYDKDLAGLPGVLKTERDILGKPIIVGVQTMFDPENGRDLYLSIDKSVQEIAKKKLKEGIENYKAAQGCVIVANPSNMEILALTCLPDFDAQNYYLFSEDVFKNPTISNLYEPGSIFKPLVMAAAIEEKRIKPDDFYEEAGPIRVANYTIQTWNNKYEGKITATRILEKSSNVGMVWVGEKLGKDKLYSYLDRYGFGKLTGIDLQGEVAGYIKAKNNWYPIDFTTLTFGQGIAVTPIQMLRAFTSLVNGGNLYSPYVVAKIKSSDSEKSTRLKFSNRTISERTSKIIVKMLVATVENGEAKWVKPKGYKVGGKTGTAQIPIAGRYDPAKTIASFIGFAPADDPSFIVLVSLREPKTSPWGSETAAPIFFEIAKELLVYYNIAPQ